MRSPVLATAWRALTEPLARIGRPKPFDGPRLRQGDILKIEIRKVDEDLFRCELDWRKPGGERGMSLVDADYPHICDLVKWLDRVAGFPRDIHDQLWNHPVGDRPIVDMVFDQA